MTIVTIVRRKQLESSYYMPGIALSSLALSLSLYIYIYKLLCVCVLVAKSCPTLCNPIDCSPPGPSVHGILQARILNMIVISFSKRNYRKKESEVA